MGNVLVTISDRKLQLTSAGAGNEDNGGCEIGSGVDVLNVATRNGEASYTAITEVNLLPGFESTAGEDYAAYTDNSLTTCVPYTPPTIPAQGWYYAADVVGANDYYPFGSLMPGRRFSSGSYRYGFQNQEKDNEIKGEGNSINFDYRVYDVRIGKFLSIDPLRIKYPMYSPYHFSSNQPIHAKELDGLESEFDLNIPKSVNDVDTKHWTLNTQHKNPNGMLWTDPNGNKLSFDKAQFNGDGTPKPGFLGRDHWHFEDANGNRYNAEGSIAKSYGSKEAHLGPGTSTSIKIKAVVNVATATEPETVVASSVSKNKSNLTGTMGLFLTMASTIVDIFTGDPSSMINQFGPAMVGSVKAGKIKLSDLVETASSFYTVTDRTTETWTENGTQYKKVTNNVTTYYDKAWDDKKKKYVGSEPTGHTYQISQTSKDGKVAETFGGELL